MLTNSIGKRPKEKSPVGGFRFGFFTLAPASEVPPKDLNVASALAEVERALPGMFTYNEPDQPGMHTTPTIRAFGKNSFHARNDSPPASGLA